MGLIARLLSFTRTERGNSKLDDAKVNPGSGAILTAEYFTAAGEDANPLPGDYVAIVKIPGRGRGAAVGVVDPNNEQKALPGERRLYAREIGGDSVCEIWIRQNGQIVISNPNGAVTLQPNGTIDLNGATIDTGGELVCTDAVIDGIRFSTHGHPYTWTDPAGAGTTQGPV